MTEIKRFDGFGFRVDVFKATQPTTFVERVLRHRHLERVSVIGGVLPADQARTMAKKFNETKDGLIYKAVREVPIDFIV
jgi:hypothetical protein